MNLSSEQAKQLIELIQNAELPDFFAKTKEMGIQNQGLKELEKEFIFGRFPYDFYDRLQVFVNSLAQTDYEVKQPKYDIFVSYSSKNREKASRVVQTLRKTGLVVFFSDDDLKSHAGASFISKINNALEESKHFLLYCTPEAVSSPFVQHECETFLQRHIESQKKRKIFILKGENFNMDLLKTVQFQRIQLSELEQIVTILGKTMPKNNLEDRKQDYQDLFEVFFEDGKVSEKERKQLEKEQKNLGLIAEDVAEIEAKVKKAFEAKKEAESTTSQAIAETSKPQANTSANTSSTSSTSNTPSKNTLTSNPSEDTAGLSPEMLRYIGIGTAAVILFFVIMFATSWNKGTQEVTASEENTEEEPASKLEGDDENPISQEQTNDEENYSNHDVEDVQVGNVTFYMTKIPGTRYKMGEVEVTQGLWEAVMSNNPSEHQGCDACPVENVDYHDVGVFIEGLNKITNRNFRLPTSDEWEYAAKAGKAFIYSGGDNLSDIAWYDGNSQGLSHQVAEKKPNSYYLFDMAGNVWEMLETEDPDDVLIRGGSWSNESESCKIATSYSFPRMSKAKDVGFRLCENF